MEKELQKFEQEHAPRNLISNFEETVLAIAELEGEYWLKMSKKAEGEGSVKEALEYLRNNQGEDAPPISIYGGGGINRWMVKVDGSVEFSKHHATRGGQNDAGDIKKAQELGFKIFE